MNLRQQRVCRRVTAFLVKGSWLHFRGIAVTGVQVTITADDVMSLDESLLMRPRQPNGDLPVTPFVRLAPDSDAIDQGERLGNAYHGAAPDLGAFEWSPHGAP